MLVAGLIAWLSLTSVEAASGQVDCGSAWSVLGDRYPTAVERSDGTRTDDLRVLREVDQAGEFTVCHDAAVDRFTVAGWVAGVGLVAVAASAVVWRRRPA